MKCYVCDKTTDDGPLFRQNEKGVVGVWVCQDHYGAQNEELIEVVDQLVIAISKSDGSPEILND